MERLPAVNAIGGIAGAGGYANNVFGLRVQLFRHHLGKAGVNVLPHFHARKVHLADAVRACLQPRRTGLLIRKNNGGANCCRALAKGVYRCSAPATHPVAIKNPRRVSMAIGSPPAWSTQRS